MSDELSNKLLQSTSNWWNRLLGHCKIVKVKSEDSSYQKCLDSVRKDIVKKNNEEDSDIAYQVYLDMVREYLNATEKRLLTAEEEEIVIAHLKVVAATYCTKHMNLKNDADLHKGLGITQVLSIETARKVSELHEDFPEPSEAEVKQRVAEVLAVQNYLRENPKP